MEEHNQTSAREFILQGLTDDPHLQILLFVVFLLVYITTLVSNIGICTLIMTDRSLQTPMYFFLMNLSCVDICYSSVITPRMLFNFLSKIKSISFSGCVSRLFWFVAFATSESLILVIMAYDRFVAICNPLLYVIVMNRRACTDLACAAYTLSVLNAIAQATSTFNLIFCRSNEISHFFCEMSTLLKLSCTSTFVNELVILVLLVCLGVGSCVVILTSYGYIITTILRMRSVEGRRKAFSTCASHSTVVCLFYGTIFFIYFQPTSTITQKKLISVFYTVMIPMLNPLIYSLRNQEMKGAFTTLVHKKETLNSLSKILPH